MTSVETFLDPAPDAAPELLSSEAKTLVIACGALAREIIDLIAINDWPHLAITCLPAKLHNEPQKIPNLLRDKIRALKPNYDRIFVAYADCGTGGLIDKVIAEEGAQRIAGPHCYAFFAGNSSFEAMAEQEIGTFYLTDYLARHFETLILEGMGIRKYPQMRDLLFARYTRLLYLAQTDDPTLDAKAQAAADALGLRYEKHFTGYGALTGFIADAAGASHKGA